MNYLYLWRVYICMANLFTESVSQMIHIIKKRPLNQDCGNVIISKYHMLSGRYYLISRWYAGMSLSQDFTRLNRMSEGNVGLCEWYLMLRWCYTFSAMCSIHMIQVLYMRWCAIRYGVTLYQDCVIWWYGIGLARNDILQSCFPLFCQP